MISNPGTTPLSTWCFHPEHLPSTMTRNNNTSQVVCLEEAIATLQTQQRDVSSKLTEVLAKLATIEPHLWLESGGARHTPQSSLESKPCLKLDISRYEMGPNYGLDIQDHPNF